MLLVDISGWGHLGSVASCYQGFSSLRGGGATILVFLVKILSVGFYSGHFNHNPGRKSGALQRRLVSSPPPPPPLPRQVYAVWFGFFVFAVLVRLLFHSVVPPPPPGDPTPTWVGGADPARPLGVLRRSPGLVFIVPMNRIAKLFYLQQRYEGDLRFTHARAVTHCESVAFYGGGVCIVSLNITRRKRVFVCLVFLLHPFLKIFLLIT